MLKKKYILILFLIIVLVFLIYIHFRQNNKITNQLKDIENFRNRIIENYVNKNRENLIQNGDFSNGKNISNFTHSSGINNIIKKNNPGNSNYVLEQVSSNNKTYYELNVECSSNKTYYLSLWVSFKDITNSIDFKNLIKVSVPKNNKINYLSDINYNVNKRVSLDNNNSDMWYNVVYTFKTPEDCSNSMNIYLNYTSNLQAKKVYFTTIELFKVLDDAQNFTVINNLKVFLDGYHITALSKKWEDLSNENNSFTWKNKPISSAKGGYLETYNNSLTGSKANSILGNDSNTKFSCVLVFDSNKQNSIVEEYSNKFNSEESLSESENKFEEEYSSNNTPNVLTIPGNNVYSIQLFIPNGEGKIKVVFDNKGEYTKYSDRELVFYNKTTIILTYENKKIKVYQDSVKVLELDTETIHLSNENIVIGKSKNWNAKLYGVLFYNDVLTSDNMNTIRDYFLKDDNKDSSNFLPGESSNNNYVSNGSNVYDYDNLFSLDKDNNNLVGLSDSLDNSYTNNKNSCKKNCLDLCSKFLNNNVLNSNFDDFNKCTRNCVNTVKSCKDFCSSNPNENFCKAAGCNSQSTDCPIAYKKNGKYMVYVSPNSKYSTELGYDGERSYGKNRENAEEMYKINFPNCKVPDTLTPSGGKNYIKDCPFMIKDNNPCYSDHCANIDWSKKKGYDIGMSKKCKHLVSNYCELYNDIDDSCLCWRDEYRNLPGCRDFRRKYQNPNDYQCNINDFNIKEHSDYKKYIRKDKIPCWNCTIPIE